MASRIFLLGYGAEQQPDMRRNSHRSDVCACANVGTIAEISRDSAMIGIVVTVHQLLVECAVTVISVVPR
jgi:hypothetical protein